MLPLRSASLLGVLAVVLFSLTAPATRCAVLAIGGLPAGCLRIAGGGVAALLVLAATRSSWPSRHHWPHLLLIGACLTLGFPLLLSLALVAVPASHAAVVLAAGPLLTALLASLRNGERLPRSFWLWSAAGGAVVALFMARGAGSCGRRDALLLPALLASAIGYVEGARLTPALGWRTIAWAVAGMSPITIPLAIGVVAGAGYPVPSGSSWCALIYLALVSQLFAFIPWYRALTSGGVARIGQLLLGMPFLSLAAATLWLGEPLRLIDACGAMLVVLCILGCQRQRVAARAATTGD